MRFITSRDDEKILFLPEDTVYSLKRLPPEQLVNIPLPDEFEIRIRS